MYVKWWWVTMRYYIAVRKLSTIEINFSGYINCRICLPSGNISSLQFIHKKKKRMIIIIIDNT